ncbi:winged helix-turn-helix domain-containing protein [Planomonospora sp. ID67723]|uniref:AfsR/SARP family transcriptional regulator n=1 Tax=Planomonospora sp. ID67723 TaxID=2738134 RepID=UPI0018C40393|nr:BTAD domain-containing putative transcriptional regulator [Planomonospora sp. ID67723]MBG0832462.1 winged helix-turn-helix domain-containing protein [Planomonospora sp. ID67723]
MTVDTTVPAYDFQILGPLRVCREAAPLSLPAPHPRMILAVLLLHNGELVPEARLLEQVWGHGTGSTTALRTAVSRLRAWLREGVGPVARVEHADGGYRLLLPDHLVDAARFRAAMAADADTADPHLRLTTLMAALDQWRGPVLDGAPDGVRQDSAARALDDDHAACLRRLALLAVPARVPELVLPKIHALARTRPFDEPLHTRLIELYAACGRPAEALMEYERLRSRLADELGIAPSADAQRAYFAVLNQDPPDAAGSAGPLVSAGGTAPERQPGGWRHPVVPHQIPTDVAGFTGREKQTAMLLDHLGGLPDGRGPSATPVAAVTGPPGVGKTALAVHAAQRLAPVYPDGLLYADLRGSGSAPEPPIRVLGRFLRAFGVPGTAVPDDPAECAALYRSLTNDRRVLVVLDDAAGEAQVRPLLPASPSCAVIVTGRPRLVGVGGVRIVDLDRLDADHAIELLAAVIGPERVSAEPEAATELVRLCDRLPLAVRICGARLAARPHWPLARLAAALREEHRRLDELSVADLDVRDALRQGYARVRPDVRPTLERLARRGPDEFTADTVAAACGLTPAAAEEHLETLVDMWFVTADIDRAGQLRYRMDDLTRLFLLRPG